MHPTVALWRFKIPTYDVMYLDADAKTNSSHQITGVPGGHTILRGNGALGTSPYIHFFVKGYIQ